MAIARRFGDGALAYVARQRALDPRSPCEPGAGMDLHDSKAAEKGHLKFDCALAVLEWTDAGGAEDEDDDVEEGEGEVAKSRSDEFFDAMRQKKDADAAAEERKRAETLAAMGEAEREDFVAQETAAKEHEEKKAATLQKQMGAFAGRGAKQGAMRGRGRGRGRGGGRGGRGGTS